MSASQEFDYDLFVIGGGSGGVRAARMAAGTGAKVLLAEEFRFGGTCVIRGCVPKKLLSYASHMGEELEDAASFGWDVSVNGFSWPKLIANKDREIDRLENIYRDVVLKNAGVESTYGRAVVTGPNSVRIAGPDGSREVTAARILLAVGGAPVKPDLPGVERAITSNEALHLEELPKKVVVYGSGYIAVEFAGIFAGLGAETHLVYRADKVLRGFDEEVRDFLTDEVGKKGLNLHSGQEIVSVEEDGVTLEDGSRIEADCVMFATGRAPNTKDLGLEGVGVELDRRGAVVVDEKFQTSVPSIFALGDVINRIQLTPVALAEAMVFVDNEFRGMDRVMDYADITTAVFSNPQIATVGLSEEAARESFDAIEVYTSNFKPMKLTFPAMENPERNERTFMKLIVDKASDRIVGAHMVGIDSAEIMQGIGIAVRMRATKADFDRTIGIHPTSAEEFVTMRTKARD